MRVCNLDRPISICIECRSRDSARCLEAEVTQCMTAVGSVTEREQIQLCPLLEELHSDARNRHSWYVQFLLSLTAVGVCEFCCPR